MRHFELFSSYFHQWLLTFFFPKLSLVAGKLFDKIIDLLHGPSSQDDTPSSRSGQGHQAGTHHPLQHSAGHRDGDDGGMNTDHHTVESASCQLG